MPPPTLDETAASDFDNNLCDAILPLLEGESQDILLQYYGARLLVRCNRLDEAAAWMEKVQVLKPDFWALKLELLALSLPEQTLSPAFRTNLEYFIRHAREVKPVLLPKLWLEAAAGVLCLSPMPKLALHRLQVHLARIAPLRADFVPTPRHAKTHAHV